MNSNFPPDKGIKVLGQLLDSELDALKHCFDNNKIKIEKNEQTIAKDLTPVMPIISKYINEVLGEGTWTIASGHFFNSPVSYAIHTDGSAAETDPTKIWQTFLFPIDCTPIDPNLPMGDLKVLVLEQTWNSTSATFRRGDKEGNFKLERFDKGQGHVRLIYDYKDVGNLKPPGYQDPLFRKWTNFSEKNTEGFSVEEVLPWEPGLVVTFPRTRLHCSSKFAEMNVKSKRALSIFTSVRDQ